MQNQPVHHYRGYAVLPSAHRLPDGYFSSNLLLERPRIDAGGTLYRFDSLDYFNSADKAVRYAARWARHWIDSRG
jgi:hypothetical protein